MNRKSQKAKVQNLVNQSPVEAFKDIAGGLADSAVNDLGKAAVSDLWEQFLSTNEKTDELPYGDLREGEEISLRKIEKGEKDPGIEYNREIRELGKKAAHENTQVIRAQVEEILAELKKITETSQELVIEYRQLSVEQPIEKPGEYHVSFFEWLLSLVKTARMKIEDSGSWLSVMKSKKSQKRYWAMFGKHGTSFGLSNERVVATQTG